MTGELHLFALAATNVAFANTVVSDNLSWSIAYPATSGSAPECTAYSQHQLSAPTGSNSGVTLPTMLAMMATQAALSAVGHSNGGVPDPCRQKF